MISSFFPQKFLVFILAVRCVYKGEFPNALLSDFAYYSEMVKHTAPQELFAHYFLDKNNRVWVHTWTGKCLTLVPLLLCTGLDEVKLQSLYIVLRKTAVTKLHQHVFIYTYTVDVWKYYPYEKGRNLQYPLQRQFEITPWFIQWVVAQIAKIWLCCSLFFFFYKNLKCFIAVTMISHCWKSCRGMRDAGRKEFGLQGLAPGRVFIVYRT